MPSSREPTIYRDIKDCHLVVELRDIRVPQSSAVNFLSTKFGSKARVVFFTKSDLVEAQVAAGVLSWAQGQGMQAYKVRAVGNRRELQRIFQKVATDYSRSKKTALGLIRIVIVGLPNVGKSTLINALKGRNVARAANSPGVTRGRQWIRLSDNVALLDTPGVATIAKKRGLKEDLRMRLGLCRILPEKDWEHAELALWLHAKLADSGFLLERLKSDLGAWSPDFQEFLEQICERYHYRLKGEARDCERAASMFCSWAQKQLLPSMDLDGVFSA